MKFPRVSEKFLRHVWQHQLFTKPALRTSDGRPVHIIKAGTLNTDGGPDFVDAKIRIGRTTYHGDVELHRDAADWQAHRHADDPHYNRVILHVVVTADEIPPPSLTAARRPLPLLVLHPFLDAVLSSPWTQSTHDEESEGLRTIKCYSLNDSVRTDVITQWIDRLAHERIELKVRQFEERLKQLVDEQRHSIREPYPRYYGNPEDIPIPQNEYARQDFARIGLWEQLIYEGIMEGLGYAKNREPFTVLARSMRLEVLRPYSLDNTMTMMSLLFGAGGLLPPARKVQGKEAQGYVRPLRKKWKEIRRSLKIRLLSEGDWQFFRLRPGNFPTARLAAMCYLLPSLFMESGIRRLVDIFRSEMKRPAERIKAVRSLFAFQPDEFWRQHYRFSRAQSPSGIAVGESRINEILVNIIIPIMLLYARIFRDPVIRTSARDLLNFVPPSENSITRLIQRQLLKKRIALHSALEQQGAIQLYKFYCTPVRCTECAIGRQTLLGAEKPAG